MFRIINQDKIFILLLNLIIKIKLYKIYLCLWIKIKINNQKVIKFEYNKIFLLKIKRVTNKKNKLDFHLSQIRNIRVLSQKILIIKNKIYQRIYSIDKYIKMIALIKLYLIFNLLKYQDFIKIWIYLKLSINNKSSLLLFLRELRILIQIIIILMVKIIKFKYIKKHLNLLF